MRITKITGFQQFTSTAITSAVACSTALLGDIQSGQFANAALFSVGGSSGAVRFRDDGTAPTSNIGMRLPSGIAPYFYQGDLQRIKFIVDSVPGNADVNITYVQAID